MICLMFPGQPLSAPEPPQGDPHFDAVAAKALVHAGLDLQTLEWHDVPSTEQVKLQVYGVAASLHAARRLEEEGVAAAVVAEHSMGIYAALAVAGAVAEEEALEMSRRSGDLMARRFAGGRWSLGCVTGLTLEPLLALAENHGIFLANHNTSRHFLLSGERGRIEAAMAEALAGGAFTARTFPCDAPLHSPLLEEAEGELLQIFRDYRYREPRRPVLEHFSQECLTAAEMAEFMAREVALPVFWERSWRALRRMGVTRFIEAGAGDSLKKYNRWIEGENR